MAKAILIADDSENDVVLLMETFCKAGLAADVFSVHDGEELIRFLTGSGIYFDRKDFPLPGLIVLDWKMPKVDGLDILKWLHNRKEFSEIPVVVLTGCEAPLANKQALNLGAKHFLTKPCSPADVQKLSFLLLSDSRARAG